MGLLSQGRPLDWDETKKYAKFVQQRGIAQLINVYTKSKDRADGPFKWGDELEYILVKFDHQTKTVRVSLTAEQVFKRIEDKKREFNHNKSIWHPEFASYMVEGTPAVPYGVHGLLLPNLCEIEKNLLFRRQEVLSVLDPDESVMSLTSFPRLGCLNFTHPIHQPKPKTSASGSLFFPDKAIYNGHPRFKTLVKNIRARRRRKVIINLPIFRDKLTMNPFIEEFPDEEARRAVKPNHVYMDAMGFGMGCCCLQLTMQATHLAEAKVLYDQLAPLTPIMLALSAASPVYRGYLTDRDCRWDVIVNAVDDRTREEAGLTRDLKDATFKIPKSRYDSISYYLSACAQKYNDIPLVYDENFFNSMVASNVEPSIARHFAHLFIRDPITLYKEKLEQTDDDLDHFENIQSTNWQTLRFKPPPSVQSSIGWRVEFRPMEAQISDFENAAYIVFITLLSRVILACKLNLLVPISLVDKNMVEAQKRDAVCNGRFWFRSDILRSSSCKEPLSTVLNNCCDGLSENNNSTQSVQFNNNTTASQAATFQQRSQNQHDLRRSKRASVSNNTNASDIKNCATQMTIDEIINGREGFVGLMPIVWHYVESLDDGSNSEAIIKIKQYLRLISDRASLKLKTTARMMRDFIDAHPKYARDSVVNDEVAYDLLQMMDKIGKCEVTCRELTGDLNTNGLLDINQHHLLLSPHRQVASAAPTTSTSSAAQPPPPPPLSSASSSAAKVVAAATKSSSRSGCCIVKRRSAFRG